MSCSAHLPRLVNAAWEMVSITLWIARHANRLVRIRRYTKRTFKLVLTDIAAQERRRKYFTVRSVRLRMSLSLQQQILFTRPEVIKLLPAGYQRANRPSMLAAYDKFTNNWENILQPHAPFKSIRYDTIRKKSSTWTQKLSD